MLRPIDQYIVDGFRDDPDSMAVVEQLLENYFDRYMASEMDRARSDVYQKQADFLRQPTGPLSAMANASNPAHFDDRLSREILLGGYKDLFKSPEDMVLFCKRQLRLNLGMREDMTLLTQAWRHSALIRIGRDEYDRISQRLGEDLATAYMDYRLSELILKKMVKEQAPTSTVDYVVRKACEGSLFGIAHNLNKTPMQARIDEEAEHMFDPSEGAKTSAKIMSVALDAPMTGALTCWGSLIGVGALEVGLEVAQPVLISHTEGQKKQSTVEQILSRAMFHSQEDEFAKMRSRKLDYISETNVVNTLQPKMHNSPELFSHPELAQNLSSSSSTGNVVPTTKSESVPNSVIPQSRQQSVFNDPFNVAENETQQSVFTQSPYPGNSRHSSTKDTGSQTDMDAVSTPYSRSEINSSISSQTTKPLSTNSSNQSTNPLSTNQSSSTKPASSSGSQNTGTFTTSEDRGKDNRKTKSNADKNTLPSSKDTSTDGGDEQNVVHQSSQLSQNDTTIQTQITSEENPIQNGLDVPTDEDREMASQWAPLIGQFGVNGIKNVGANLGLILATLPDMLFGIFSKHDNNSEFSWSKNLIPLASLLLGFKFHNPLLKMLLVGYGGMGIIKNGMDHIAENDHQQRQFGSLQSMAQQRQPRFVPYAEQPLNPRIENLKINNNILVMDIDRIPYSVTLPDTVVMAYQSKSLPLSTLANAVLQKYDQAVSMNAQNDMQQGMRHMQPHIDLSSSQPEAVTLK